MNTCMRTPVVREDGLCREAAQAKLRQRPVCAGERTALLLSVLLPSISLLSLVTVSTLAWYNPASSATARAAPPHAGIEDECVRIDFESLPGGTPTDGLPIDTQYRDTHGVIFGLEGGGTPLLAEVGGEATAFLGPPNHSTSDTPASGQNIGRFFLTDDGILSVDAVPLIVTYEPPTDAASGVILDLDFDESFVIEARNEAGDVVQTIMLQAGTLFTGDGIATPWTFQRQTADIASIRFTGGRSAFGQFGLGFDNFCARSHTPLPPTFEVHLPILQR